MQSLTRPLSFIIANYREDRGQVLYHDVVIKWKHFPRYWPFVRGIHRSPVNSQWRGALMFSLICVWINGWANNDEAGDLRRYRAHYDVTLMIMDMLWENYQITLSLYATITQLSIKGFYTFVKSPQYHTVPLKTLIVLYNTMNSSVGEYPYSRENITKNRRVIHLVSNYFVTVPIWCGNT